MLINYVPSAHGSRDLGPVRLEKGHSAYYGSEPVATKFMLFEFDNDIGGDLDPDQSTGPLMLVTDEGPDATGAGMVMYQRLPDGELNTVAV